MTKEAEGFFRVKVERRVVGDLAISSILAAKGAYIGASPDVTASNENLTSSTSPACRHATSCPAATLPEWSCRP